MTGGCVYLNDTDREKCLKGYKTDKKCVKLRTTPEQIEGQNVENILTNQTKWCSLDVSEGRIVCPVCQRKTDQVVTGDTRAENLVVYCKWCKRELTVTIENSSARASDSIRE